MTAAAPRVRILILAGGLIGLFALVWLSTGELVPSDPTETLLFQTCLLALVFSVSLTELRFTSPAEALVNATTAGISVIAVVRDAPALPSALLLSYLALVFIAGVVCIHGQRAGTPNTTRTHRAAYLICSRLGRARVLYTIVLLVVVVFFVEKPTAATSALLAYWAAVLAIWPLGLPQWLSYRLSSRGSTDDQIGTINRIDSPGLARVRLSGSDPWDFPQGDAVLVDMPDGRVLWGIPLFSEYRDDDRWGSLLMTSETASAKPRAPGTVRRSLRDHPVRDARELLRDVYGSDLRLVGLVQDGSTVSSLKFEALPGAAIELGTVVAVGIGPARVYYQVVSGQTQEERFDDLTYGSHQVVARQLGTFDGQQFASHQWLPSMNSPVFVAKIEQRQEKQPGEFELGTVVGTSLQLRGEFTKRLESHTALLGMTGTGKTEYALELVRHAAEQNVKVMCIDLTSQYLTRLDSPHELSIDPATAADLGLKLFDVESGDYGGREAKRVLEPFITQLRTEVNQRLEAFLTSGDSVGLIELPEISNSQLTLTVTELYMSSLLNIARTKGLQQKVLVVVEEAHTVMPEANFIGSGDFSARGTVARISQVALQGRKYGVGLLVIAQRTATVTKSVLTQCSTVISFACVDESSIDFLSNLLGRDVAESLPSLGRLRAVAHGDWIGSETPVRFEVPFDQSKADTEYVPPRRISPSGLRTNSVSPTTPPAPAPAAGSPESDDPPF